MATITRFEEIVAWQLARQLANRIYDATEAGAFSRSFPIRNQIERSAVSVMANIAEGFDRRSSRDFARFLVIAKASASETRSLLYLAGDREFITLAQRDDLLKLSWRLAGLLAGLIKSLQPPSGRGPTGAQTVNREP
ncbi:MAG: four helix bundle protein [Gemmatimonadota bacterium]